jgi:SAM-dependent methyltransferase
MSASAGTGLHWNERALSVADDIDVNIMDVFQRELEYDAINALLDPAWRMLEVGCGNGYSTQRFRDRVAHIDAMDVAPAMIERARSTVGETNNSFIHDDILAPASLAPPYDAVLCVRVLINLADLAQQLQAIEVMAGLLEPGGTLILAEGFKDGFDALSGLRSEVGLSPVQPAAINFYSSLDQVMPQIERSFELEKAFHLGAYDYLTRALYPLVAGEENARANTVMSEHCAALARAFNPDAFERFSRMRGFVLRRR